MVAPPGAALGGRSVQRSIFLCLKRPQNGA